MPITGKGNLFSTEASKENDIFRALGRKYCLDFEI